ncbi:hypothetical protein H4R33_002348 [Dimargaris cristalligena]|nr:hypothetical protein H4R33_002348 [Dimargaris cristalligena]
MLYATALRQFSCRHLTTNVPRPSKPGSSLQRLKLRSRLLIALEENRAAASWAAFAELSRDFPESATLQPSQYMQLLTLVRGANDHHHRLGKEAAATTSCPPEIPANATTTITHRWLADLAKAQEKGIVNTPSPSSDNRALLLALCRLDSPPPKTFRWFQTLLPPDALDAELVLELLDAFYRSADSVGMLAAIKYIASQTNIFHSLDFPALDVLVAQLFPGNLIQERNNTDPQESTFPQQLTRLARQQQASSSPEAIHALYQLIYPFLDRLPNAAVSDWVDILVASQQDTLLLRLNQLPGVGAHMSAINLPPTPAIIAELMLGYSQLRDTHQVNLLDNRLGILHRVATADDFATAILAHHLLDHSQQVTKYYEHMAHRDLTLPAALIEPVLDHSLNVNDLSQLPRLLEALAERNPPPTPAVWLYILQRLPPDTAPDRYAAIHSILRTRLHQLTQREFLLTANDLITRDQTQEGFLALVARLQQLPNTSRLCLVPSLIPTALSAALQSNRAALFNHCVRWVLQHPAHSWSRADIDLLLHGLIHFKNGKRMRPVLSLLIRRRGGYVLSPENYRRILTQLQRQKLYDDCIHVLVYYGRGGLFDDAVVAMEQLAKQLAHAQDRYAFQSLLNHLNAEASLPITPLVRAYHIVSLTRTHSASEALVQFNTYQQQQDQPMAAEALVYLIPALIQAHLKSFSRPLIRDIPLSAARDLLSVTFFRTTFTAYAAPSYKAEFRTTLNLWEAKHRQLHRRDNAAAVAARRSSVPMGMDFQTADALLKAATTHGLPQVWASVWHYLRTSPLPDRPKSTQPQPQSKAFPFATPALVSRLLASCQGEDIETIVQWSEDLGLPWTEWTVRSLIRAYRRTGQPEAALAVLWDFMPRADIRVLPTAGVIRDLVETLARHNRLDLFRDLARFCRQMGRPMDAWLVAALRSDLALPLWQAGQSLDALMKGLDLQW